MSNLIKFEIWKDIKGYEKLYKISNYGRIKSFLRKGSHGGILKFKKNKDGYLYIKLFKNNKNKTFYIHRLILETFVGLCPEGKEGCHNNGNPSDNFVENLRWDTHKNNGRDAVNHGSFSNRKGSKNNNAKLNNNKIREIEKLIHEKELTQTEIAKLYNITQSIISKIKNKKIWRSIKDE